MKPGSGGYGGCIADTLVYKHVPQLPGDQTSFVTANKSRGVPSLANRRAYPDRNQRWKKAREEKISTSV